MAPHARIRDPVTRLRLLLGLLLLGLLIPSVVLIWQTQQQLRYESLHQYRTLAEEMAARINAELQRLVALEEARAIDDYQFAMLAGDSADSQRLQRSALAQLPDGRQFPGLIGHFQVDAQGRFSTPLLPDFAGQGGALGPDASELKRRQARAAQLLTLLGSRTDEDSESDGRPQLRDRSVTTRAAAASIQAPTQASAEGKRRQAQAALAPYAGQAAFDELYSAPASAARQLSNRLGQVDDLRLDRSYEERSKKDQGLLGEEARTAAGAAASSRASRREHTAVLESATVAVPEAANQAPARAVLTSGGRVRIFESEVDPVEFGLLPSGHGLLFRKVWREGQRSIQGAVFDPAIFIEGTIATSVRGSALGQMSDLVVAYQREVLQVIAGERSDVGIESASGVSGQLLYQTQLEAPLDRIGLIWSIRHLPPGPGARIVNWAGGLLLLILIGGFVVLYRLGMRQLRLAQQQRDFVSAVSHELKTPLTSIRMYAEMLRAGWASEDKRRSYYEFIHDESERLSRLIANVLQLARLERRELALEAKPMSIPTLVDLLRSKIHSQAERAGFAVEYAVDPDCEQASVEVDADAICQILINLVDNAIKFANGAQPRRVDIHASAQPRSLCISVRDYGPGVAKEQMHKIFELFYRPGNELTRDSQGTGIGLALVQQLAQAMGGSIDVSNPEPGAEFRLTLPRYDPQT